MKISACISPSPSVLVDVIKIYGDTHRDRIIKYMMVAPECKTKISMMVDPSGYTYAHEHIHIDLSIGKDNIDCQLNQFDYTVNEMKRLYKLGVRNIIEVTNSYMGRNIEFMAKVSKAANMTLLVSTGYYQQKFYPPNINDLSIADIANEFVQEITKGIDGSLFKAAVIGEIGSSLNKITQDEYKVFMASALASQETGRPISTHTTLGTMGKEQFELLRKAGVKPEKIVIGHSDLQDNLSTIIPIMSEGGYVQFDTIGKNNYYSDENRVRMLRVIKEKKLLSQVMLSMDITRRSQLKDNGGIGYSYLLDVFIPMLLNSGFEQNDIELMLKENPVRFFNS